MRGILWKVSSPLFIALTGAAVVLQAGLLAAMYLAMRKTSTRMEALAEEVKTKALPTLETTQSMLAEIRPKGRDNRRQSDGNQRGGSR